MIPNEIRTSLQSSCTILNRNKVEYLMIGGVAVAFYGYHRISGAGYGQPEITHDLDFWYNPTTENFYRLLDAVKLMGVDTSSLEKIVFDPKRSYLRMPMKTYKMEFLPQMVGIDNFSTCFERAKTADIDGLSIPFLSYSDLIQNKRALNRPIDSTDIQELNKRNPS